MTRWLFADQLGPHYAGEEPVVYILSRQAFSTRRLHRAKAHLVLSAMRHRAAELGDRMTYVQAPTYAEAVREHGDGPSEGEVEVVHPTSYADTRPADRPIRYTARRR